MKRIKRPLNLLISQDIVCRFQKVSIAAAPREACGLLFGSSTEYECQIKQFVSLPNRKRSLNNFGITKVDFEFAVNNTSHSLLGVFHSHQGGLELSDNDLKGIKKSRLVWVVFSVSTFQIKAFNFFSNSLINELGVEIV